MGGWRDRGRDTDCAGATAGGKDPLRSGSEGRASDGEFGGRWHEGNGRDRRVVDGSEGTRRDFLVEEGNGVVGPGGETTGLGGGHGALVWPEGVCVRGRRTRHFQFVVLNVERCVIKLLML